VWEVTGREKEESQMIKRTERERSRIKKKIDDYHHRKNLIVLDQLKKEEEQYYVQQHRQRRQKYDWYSFLKSDLIWGRKKNEQLKEYHTKKRQTEELFMMNSTPDRKTRQNTIQMGNLIFIYL